MAEHRPGAHAVFDINYHFVWITRYRCKILRRRITERARDLLRQICQARRVVIKRGAVSPDYIHMLSSSPPDLAPASLAQYLKGRLSAKTAR
jgi:putative transposase